MSNAIRIDTLNSSLAIQGTLHFARYEATETDAAPIFKSTVQTAQNGQPTFLLLMDTTNPYSRIPVTFRIHGDSTLGKLRTIRNHLLSGGGNLLRLYPKYVDDQSLFYDCIVDPGSIPDQSVFSGEDRAGQTVTLEFVEITKDGQSIVIDDAIIV